MPYEKKNTCRVCLSIRIFLMSVFGLVIIGIIDKNLVSGISKMSPLVFALIFVAIIGLGAFLKTVLEYRQSKSRDLK